MHIFTLVEKIRAIIEGLRRERGEFKLAMLYNTLNLDASSNWNLIVSSDWSDALGISEATNLIAEELFKELAPDDRAGISRITVLKTDDRFVKDMIRLCPVHGSGVPLQQVTAGGVTEGAAFVFYSQQPEVTV